jgi:pimeloyl-ACP methyl ester carboxylesterase
VERVVFVHGLWMTGYELWLLRARVARAGFRTERFYYRSASAPVASNAARLAAFARNLGPGPLHFVCHSLGGLVTLRMLRDHADVPAGRVVLLGSPVRGSGVAARLSARFWTRWMVGAAADDLVPDAPPDWRVHHPVGVIAGTQGVGTGRWFGGLKGANDGVVSAAETRLDGAADYLEVPYSHSMMLLARPVAGQVIAFLRAGSFDRGSARAD